MFIGNGTTQDVAPVLRFKYHTDDAAEIKMAREMLCFTIETAVGGHEGRRCRTGGCGLCSRYVRAGSFDSAM